MELSLFSGRQDEEEQETLRKRVQGDGDVGECYFRSGYIKLEGPLTITSCHIHATKMFWFVSCGPE